MNTFCSYFNQGICKSCDVITMDYSAQIQVKEEKLRRLLPDANLLPAVLSKTEFFRNKAKFSVTGSYQEPVIGLFGEEDLDQGRELLNCPLHVKAINHSLTAIRSFITEAKLEPYQISSRKGELKGIILFYSEETKESYLRFILRSKEAIDRIRKHSSALLSQLPEVKCLSINIQPVPHAVLEGEEEIFITVNQFIQHKAGDITFSLGPRAFVQTNQAVAKVLYQTAAEWITESRTERFMELFCGQGAFSFFAAPYVRKGLGVEINPEAVVVANKTAHDFNLNHLSFISADASKVGSEIQNFNPDLILVNPPRRGLGQTTELLLIAKPRTIIYSSCNAETLASDIKKMSEAYEVKRVQLFDMFPHTSHFETLVELRRINQGD